MRLSELANRPLPTTVRDDARDFSPEPGAAYVFASSADEPRSQHARDLSERCPDAHFAEIVEQSPDALRCRCPDGAEVSVPLAAPQRLGAFWREQIGASRCYVDITALTHDVWAALVKSALEAGVDLAAVYVEPRSYRPNEINDPLGDIFKLSAEIEGLAPLPGFALLGETPSSRQMFVPLLGFEGRRLVYTRDDADDVADTVPVIGVPGYRPEFVGFAYHGNQQPLTDDGLWQRVKFAPANCPFSVYHLLRDLLEDSDVSLLRVAAIGTKPHALGAVLLALAMPDAIDIMYDHPVAAPDRTEGRARLLVYEVSLFAELIGLVAAPSE